jgi:glutamate--cysteine ligase
LGTILERLSALGPAVLRSLRRGIEKESLRVTPEGALADTAHPASLGSALTHPHITTDYSEAQLELITGVHTDADACLEELTHIHQFVYRNIGSERLWCASMPCKLPDDDSIPIGRYGSSNIGRARTVYRIGLAHRYGRRMQTISGVHYNFSLPDEAWPELCRAEGERGPERAFRDRAYFALIRNFRRHSWLLLYLFGASPAVCASFVIGRRHALRPLSPGNLYLPGATSLRMGPLGYQSEVQASLQVSYNSLESYASSLYRALTEPYPPYAAIGIRDEAGGYRQLATTLLQIENEFYSTVRAKRRVRPGERPLHALNERGVEYVEVRCLDLDPFSPVGVSTATMRFLDVFLLHCLLAPSPPDTPQEIAEIARNQHRAAEHGRDPGLKLERGGAEVELVEWGAQLLEQCEPVAQALDAAQGTRAHAEVLAAAAAALRDASRTPSARVLEEMEREHERSYPAFVLARSERYRSELLARPLPAAVESRLAQLARESLAEQRRLEAADDVPFEIFRQRYLALDLLATERASGGG